MPQRGSNNIQEKRLPETKEVLSVTDSRFRAFVVRVTKPFKKFTGTPLGEARAIMGPHMHELPVVRLHLDLAPTFFEQHKHLQRVPYTAHELAWAAENGFVLTPCVASARRIGHVGRECIGVTHTLWHNCPDFMKRAPRQGQWWLVQRDSVRSYDTASLKMKQAEQRRRLVTAPAHLALSMAFLDHVVHGIAPRAPRLTSSSVTEGNGSFYRMVTVGPEMAHRGKVIGATLARIDTTLQPVPALKPHHVFHPELY